MKRNKIFCLVMMVGIIAFGTVSAADQHDWSGWYAGWNVGVTPYSPMFGDPEFNHYGNEEGSSILVGAAGGQIGFNFQNDGLVYGIELDATYVDSTNSEAGSGVCGDVACNFEYAYTSQLDSLWSIRGRAGITVQNALLFTSIGYGEVRADHAYFDSDQAPDSPDSITASAFVVGVGGEYAFSDTMSARFEGLYYFAQTEMVTQWSEAYTIDPSTALVRFGMNFKF